MQPGSSSLPPAAAPGHGRAAARPTKPGPRSRLRQWFHARLPLTDQLQLGQSNIYILPSRAGWALALTLCVLLIAAINYQLNLGYLLSFLLAGSAVAGMVVGHGNLRGTRLHLQPPEEGFAGQPCRFEIVLHNTRTAMRWGLGLAVDQSGNAPGKTAADWAWVDVPGQGSTTVELAFTPARRGLSFVPTVTIASHYPLGSFRLWALWRPASEVWIYPTPELHAPPLPDASPHGAGKSSAGSRHGDEFDGVRSYRRGDPLKLVVWKKAAQAFATGTGALVSRDRPQALHHQLWLDAAATGLADPEARLSRLCAWVLSAEQQGLVWGMRLPDGQEIAADHGPAHTRRCLQALAACP
ncbi:DUF58 domain-containing protein [Comamonas composti]|uniref:DUF58 domain-containing protein n=1 Tax=Comamonas composti TaxID=408558 RepID=UPI0004192D51|nr:DUF58 domain-containing protein [Comamonas composti]